MTKDIAQIWSDKVSKALVGKTITKVMYNRSLGYGGRGIVMWLDDGTVLWPMADDEGNDVGALATNIEGLETIPVIY